MVFAPSAQEANAWSGDLLAPAPTMPEAPKTRVAIHAPSALERVAVHAVLSGQAHLNVQTALVASGAAVQIRVGAPDVLVWVGNNLGSWQPPGPWQTRPAILAILRDTAPMTAVTSLRAGATGLACLSCHLGQLPDAVKVIASGQGWFAPCLAKALADHLAGRARLHSARICGLTARELLILRSIAIGADNAQVADDLGIDVRTVKFHTSNIYRKLGARHRAEAVAKAYRLGLTA